MIGSFQQKLPGASSGEYYIWLCGSAVAFCLLLVGGLLSLIIFNGMSSFWPARLNEYLLVDGQKKLGEQRAIAGASNDAPAKIQLKQANRDIYGEDFIWIEQKNIASVTRPRNAVVVERLEWGKFYGYIKRVEEGEKIVASDESGARELIAGYLAEAEALRNREHALSKNEIGAVNFEQERIRLRMKKLGDAIAPDEKAALVTKSEILNKRYLMLEEELSALKAKDVRALVLGTEDGVEKTIPLSQVVHLHFVNEMSAFSRLRVFIANIWEFVSTDPRESNTEGGVFPAIFGTVMAVFLMTIVVVPFGVISAIFLREYAKQGKFVALVRIAVNNLAGVPSIVFGVFGVGFFIYFLGGSIDRLFFSEALPSPTFGTGGILWASLTLALLTVPTVIVATEEGLASIPRHLREGSYALGATKFETVWKVVLPSLAPSILTGTILAVARAAGEVAPLMITGVVKLAPSLPLDGTWPFVHVDRKFMHLGFHIYDVGFQSPNVEAARPMVYSTTLLLLVLVLLLNLLALVVRNRLKKRFATSAV